MVRGEKQNLRPSLRKSDQWEFDVFTQKSRPEIDRRFQAGGIKKEGKLFRHSHSGSERNHLFLSDRGESFTDISAVSGLDTPADSRTFVLWDFNRDGWLDIAMVNANTPLLNVFRNDIGQLQVAPEVQGRMIAIKFVGGNNGPHPSNSWTCRDGYGAKVEVALTNAIIHREHRCGEGFAAQNSATMIIGIGNHHSAKSISVLWPSGIQNTIREIPAGTLVTVYEDENATPAGSSFVTSDYLIPHTRTTPVSHSMESENRIFLPSFGIGEPLKDETKLILLTTMATWCDACKKQLPQLAFLRSQFAERDMAMFGVPVDVMDDAKQLNSYVHEFRPPYHLLGDLGNRERLKMNELMDAALNSPTLPATMVTNGHGQILKAFPGVPTLSELEELRLYHQKSLSDPSK